MQDIRRKQPAVRILSRQWLDLSGQFHMRKGLSFMLAKQIRQLLFLACLWSPSAFADHYAGATLSYTCLGGNFYTVFLDVYLNCSGVAITGQTIELTNSCGVIFTQTIPAPTLTEEVSQLCASQIATSTCNGGTQPGFRRHRFATNVFLSPCNFWTISWTLCCRNTTVNLFGTPGIYAETTFNNVSGMGGLCDDSPIFADNGVPFLCVNAPVAYNPGASDPNGNIMSFSLITGRLDAFNNVNYRSGFTGSSPIPGINIDANTGQLTFTPTVTGNYIVVIRVSTFNSLGQLIGTVMRDLMFVVIPCGGSPPLPGPLTNITGAAGFGPNSVAVCQGQSFCADMVVTDPNPSTVITVTSNATALLPGSTFQVTGTNPVTVRLCWAANLALLPRNVFIEMTDGSCPIENIATRSIYVGSCLLLPIELIAFNAKQEGTAVALSWTTATETGNDFFTVERSSDGILFQPIGRVEAAGQSTVLQEYGHVDQFPLRGLAYYRLRQTDTDGQFSFSDVVTVEYGSEEQLTATFDGSATWTFHGLSENSTWSLVDALGRTLAVGQQSTSADLQLAPNRDATGLLLFTLVSADRSQTLRLPAYAPAGAMISVNERTY